VWVALGGSLAALVVAFLRRDPVVPAVREASLAVVALVLEPPVHLGPWGVRGVVEWVGQEVLALGWSTLPVLQRHWAGQHLVAPGSLRVEVGVVVGVAGV
jgi:hypothetical protein